MNVSFPLVPPAKYLRPLSAHDQCAMGFGAQLCIATTHSNQINEIVTQTQNNKENTYSNPLISHHLIDRQAFGWVNI